MNTLTPEQIRNLKGALQSSAVFKLYTQKNSTDGQILRADDASSISASNWDASKPTVFVTHGWKCNGEQPVCTMVRDAYLKTADYNIIVLDWGNVAENTVYKQVAQGIRVLAEFAAHFINFMCTSAGLQLSSTKMVGHSLGAHVLSLASKIVSPSSEIVEIVALDPASPMLECNGPDGRVDKSHGKHVQVVHTCASILGFSSSIGTSDFFANDGTNQPGCGKDMTRSHQRAYEYFSESIINPKGFLGKSKDGATAYMGGVTLDPNAKGTYHFQTNSEPPYARG